MERHLFLEVQVDAEAQKPRADEESWTCFLPTNLIRDANEHTPSEEHEKPDHSRLKEG